MRFAYFDEAGLAQEPFMVVGGFMLHVDGSFSAIQKYLLDMADDLVGQDRPHNFVFHAKDLWHGSGFFPRDQWPLKKRLEILGHLADIPQKFELPIIYSCVSRKIYAPEIKPDHSDREIAQARAVSLRKRHVVCFMSCLSQVDRWMKEVHKDELVFLVVENHKDHKGILLEAAKLLSNPRLKPIIDDDPNISWRPVTSVAEDPLFMEKSGSSPLQIADICVFIISRALAGRNHSSQFLERIEPQLVSGFRKSFVEVSSARQEAE